MIQEPRARFGDMIELTAGETLPLTTTSGEPHVRLTMGVGWDKDPTAGAIASGRPDIDLDASAIQFADGKLFDLAFFNNLVTRDGSVTHLGDNTTGRGEGDDEAIALDLARVHGPVDTIFLVVTSYHGHSLTWVDGAYVRIRDADGRAFARFTITAGPPEPGLVLAKLTRVPATSTEASSVPPTATWTLHAIGRGIEATTATDAVVRLASFG